MRQTCFGQLRCIAWAPDLYVRHYVIFIALFGPTLDVTILSLSHKIK